jgi:hypothetical protein
MAKKTFQFYTCIFFALAALLAALPSNAQLFNNNNNNSMNNQYSNNNQSNYNNSMFQQQNSGYNNNNQGNSSQSNSRSRSNRSRSRSQTDGQNTANSRNTRSNPASTTAAPNATGNVKSKGNRPPASTGGAAGEGVQVQGGAPQGSSSNAKAGARRPVADQTIQQNAILLLKSSTSVGVLNDPLIVSVELANKKKEEIDRLAFTLRYDPQDLLLAVEKGADGNWVKANTIPLPASSPKDASASVSGAAKISLLASDSSKFKIVQNLVDSQNGLISFEMTAIGKPVAVDGAIVLLTFVPIREAQTTVAFQFINPIKREPEKEPITCLTLAGEDQLGTRFSKSDGVINLDLSIYKSQEDAEREPLIAKSGDKADEDEEKGAPITLSLDVRDGEVSVGDTVNVDVVVSNPDRKSFDAVNLLIAYNPHVFEPVDGDKNAPGINVNDSENKERFPMDFSVVNNIDKEKGIIDYRKKAMRKPCRAQGVLATIQLRALRPTTKTTFRLFLSETRQEPTTGVSFRFQDRLGDASDPFDGVKTCSVGVRATTASLSNR